MHTAVWLIVLTMIVVGAIPVLLIYITTLPHPKLLMDTLQYQPTHYLFSNSAFWGGLRFG